MNDISDWTEIPITFRAKCYDCGKEILPGPAFWSDSKKSAKHLKCGRLKNLIDGQTLEISKPTIVPHHKDSGGSKKAYENIELKCFVCGMMAGCHACTFSPICDRTIVSQVCICETCSSSPNGDVFEKYQQVFTQKYLNKKK